MRTRTKALANVHPFSMGLLLLGGEVAAVLHTAALLLFLFAHRMPQPAAAYTLAGSLAGIGLRLLLLAVLIAVANDIAAGLLKKPTGRP